MEEVGTSRTVQFLVCFAVSLASMTSGVSIYWTTPVLPKFHDNQTGINITEKELSWMAAISSPGTITGSLATSFLADRFGRRLSVLASAPPIAIGTILSVFATKPWMLYIMRFAWGCGVGLCVTSSSIYLVEIADKNIRGSLSVGNRFMFNFGSFLVMAIGPFVTYQTLNYMLLVLPVGFFAACWWIPETPYFLLKEGKVEAAREELMKLRGYKDDKILEEQLSLMKADVKKEMQRSGTAKELFTGRQYRKALIISLAIVLDSPKEGEIITKGLKLTQVMSGSIPILQYLGRIIQESKTDIEVSTALIIFGAVRFVVGIISSLLVDKIGRRPLLITSYIGTSTFLAIVGVYFYFQEVIGISNESTNPLRYITLAGIICANVISTLGFDSLVFVIPAEIFPINVKSIAMTACNIFGGCATFIMVKGYQEVKDMSGLYGVFWFFAASAFIGGLFSYFVVPETKGKSLREIQVELQGFSYDDACLNLNRVVNDKENGSDCEITESKEFCDTQGLEGIETK